LVYIHISSSNDAYFTYAEPYQPKMPSATAVFTVIAGIVALIAGYVYFFGIPPEAKRQMEEKALETMGENKASYMMKGISSQAIRSTG